MSATDDERELQALLELYSEPEPELFPDCPNHGRLLPCDTDCKESHYRVTLGATGKAKWDDSIVYAIKGSSIFYRDRPGEVAPSEGQEA